MKINSISITSQASLDFELKGTKPITILRGKNSSLALDLIREVIGERNFSCEQVDVDGGHFIIHTEVEMGEKNYSVCYIRNAESDGDNRIAVNFKPRSVEFSRADTMEFLEKSNETTAADRPVFIYPSTLGDKNNVTAFIQALSGADRQVFVALPEDYSEINHDNIMNVFVG